MEEKIAKLQQANERFSLIGLQAGSRASWSKSVMNGPYSKPKAVIDVESVLNGFRLAKILRVLTGLPFYHAH